MSGASESAAAATAVMLPPFTVNSPAPSVTPPHHQMGMPYAAADGGAPSYGQAGPSAPAYQSIPPGAVVINHLTPNSSDHKRKRGRPRKYGPDNGSVPNPIAAASPHQQQQQKRQSINAGMSHPHPHPQPQPQPQPQQSINAGIPHYQQQQQQTQQQQGFPSPVVSGPGEPSAKKARGRPRGSINKMKKPDNEPSSGSSASGLTTHALNVKAGEDVSLKILSVSQNGPSAVCVLSATGTISNVTLHQPAASGGTATYEGRFDILSLMGSFLLSEVSGLKSRTGGLSVTLAGPNGLVIGGSIAGMLVAASPIQVIVGSFMLDKEGPVNHMEPSPLAPSKMNMGGTAGTSSSPSRGTLSESSEGAASPLNLGSGAGNIHQSMSGMQWK